VWRPEFHDVENAIMSEPDWRTESICRLACSSRDGGRLRFSLDFGNGRAGFLAPSAAGGG
jgi:hypothetical protein